MLKTLKILAISIYVVCGGLLIFFTLPKTGYKALSVATSSMTPAIPQGSLVFIHKSSNSSIHTGDVVTYINPQNTKQTITHRVVAMHNLGSIPGFITKGDANNTADQPILGGNVVGTVFWHIPHAGKILSWGKTLPGLVLFVIIPGVLIVIDEMARLARVLGQPEEKPAKDTPNPQKPVQTALKQPTRPLRAANVNKRSFDGIKIVVLVLTIALFSIGATKAQLKSTAKLTGNTILTANLVSGTCTTGSTSVTISHTGPGSTNTVIIHNHCSSTTTNTNNVNVTTNTQQSATTGSASSGNSDATSGDASNSAQTESQVSTTQ